MLKCTELACVVTSQVKSKGQNDLLLFLLMRPKDKEFILNLIPGGLDTLCTLTH